MPEDQTPEPTFTPPACLTLVFRVPRLGLASKGVLSSLRMHRPPKDARNEMQGDVWLFTGDVAQYYEFGGKSGGRDCSRQL
jgi:hypothetical protein